MNDPIRAKLDMMEGCGFAVSDREILRNALRAVLDLCDEWDRFPWQPCDVSTEFRLTIARELGVAE